MMGDICKPNIKTYRNLTCIVTVTTKQSNHWPVNAQKHITVKYKYQMKEEPWKPKPHTTGTILLQRPSGWHIFGLTEWSNEVILFNSVYHQDYLNTLYRILDSSLVEQETWGLQWRQQQKVLQNINYHSHNTLQTTIQQSLLWKPK